MIKIFKKFGEYTEIPFTEKGCWLNVIQPTQPEIQKLTDEFKIPSDIINDIMDTDEIPRVEFDDDFTLIIMRIPVESTTDGVPYQTVPLGIFINGNYTLTLCLQNNEILPADNLTTFRDQYKLITDNFNFILRLFLRSGIVFLRHLKQIKQQISLIEQDLEKSIKNRELNKLLKMEKCLVYFTTSLKSNNIVLTKIRNSKKIAVEINTDLLEDAEIENMQALELAQIYSDIQSGMMDAFASVISNNLTDVMKKLTLISVILMIPTLIASIYGMNVPNYMEKFLWAFPLILIFSLLLSFISVLLFKKRKWF